MNATMPRRTAAPVLASIFALLTPHTAIAQEVRDGAATDASNQIMVGAGVLFTESPFEGEGTLSNPIPLIRAKFGPAYLDGLEAGQKIATAGLQTLLNGQEVRLTP